MVLLLCCGLLAGCGDAQGSPPAKSPSPVGLWKTFDDKTGRERAMVRIFEQDGQLFGRIERTFTPGGEHRLCVPCTDERRNQPIIGLLVIRHLRPDGDTYTGGDILDPETGSIYRCKLHVEPGGSRLTVRGYIGISLLGRTQTWRR